MTGTGRISDRLEVQEVSRDPAFARPADSPGGTRPAYFVPAHGRCDDWARSENRTALVRLGTQHQTAASVLLPGPATGPRASAHHAPVRFFAEEAQLSDEPLLPHGPDRTRSHDG